MDNKVKPAVKTQKLTQSQKEAKLKKLVQLHDLAVEMQMPVNTQKWVQNVKQLVR